MSIQFRPLGKVKQMVESVGMEITYAYDDLVFSNHSMFIIRFNDNKPNLLFLHFNVDCNLNDSVTVERKLIIAGKEAGFDVKRMSKFKIKQIEGRESLEIVFA